MAKGYDQHRERLAAIQGFGKGLAKRAAFVCEWCGGDDQLKPQDLAPALEPSEETLALLCGACRELVAGGRVDPSQVRSLEGALWHPVSLVAEGAAQVLARTKADWALEAIEGSPLDDGFKAELRRYRG